MIETPVHGPTPDGQRDAQGRESDTLAAAFLAEFEYKLHVAAILNDGDEACARYLIENRERLLPHMLAAADRNGEEPDHVVARFVRGVHERHLSGASLASEPSA